MVNFACTQTIKLIFVEKREIERKVQWEEIKWEEYKKKDGNINGDSSQSIVVIKSNFEKVPWRKMATPGQFSAKSIVVSYTFFQLWYGKK